MKKEVRVKTLLSILFIVIMIAVITAVYITQFAGQDEEKDENIPVYDEDDIIFTYDIGECDQSLSDDWSTYIADHTWINSTTLVIEAHITINCANTIVNVSYSINGTKILLYYDVAGEGNADCMCPHKVIYRLEQINKKNYTIEFGK